MVKSMNAAIAGLKAHQTRLDVIGNNVANVNTWGYKARTTNFQDSVYANIMNGSAGSATVGSLGGINASQLGYGAVVSSVSTDFSTSSGYYTGNDLDCMVDGTGFFIVSAYKDLDAIPTDENGEADLTTAGVYFSRVGIFSPDANGYLVDNNGYYVFGYGTTTDADGNTRIETEGGLKPIRIPQATDEDGNPQVDEDGNDVLISVVTWRIGNDGTIVVTDKDNNVYTIGQIAVASIENANGLNQRTGYYYEVGNNSGRVTGMPTREATGMIKSGFLEMSNVDLASDFAAMITTERGYQANTKIITVTDEMLQELVNMKR